MLVWRIISSHADAECMCQLAVAVILAQLFGPGAGKEKRYQSLLHRCYFFYLGFLCLKTAKILSTFKSKLTQAQIQQILSKSHKSAIGCMRITSDSFSTSPTGAPGCFVKRDIASNGFQTPQKFIRKQSIVKLEYMQMRVRELLGTRGLGCGDCAVPQGQK